MAKSASVKSISNSDNRGLTFQKILNAFESFSLSLIYENTISYLPLGDTNFDWTYADASHLDEIKEILNQKYQKEELVGFVVYWKNHKAGMNILLYPNTKEISFLLDRYRKELEDIDVIDFSWYLERILPILLSLHISIEVIECIDSL